MKQFLITFFIGKPRKGERVNYNKPKETITVPFNVSYDIWQQAVQEHGHMQVITWFQKLYK